MNTPAHLIFASCAFARPNNPKTIWAAIAGGFIPDASLYFMAAWSRWIQGNSFDFIFNVQYFSQEWHNVFRIDNSFVLWGLLLGLAIRVKRDWLIAFSGAALLHLALDFPLHHNDGRAHFWPLSDWVFNSPVSYWHPHYYGNIVGPFEIALVLGCTALLWRRFQSPSMRMFFCGIAALQVVPFIVFGIMF